MSHTSVATSSTGGPAGTSRPGSQKINPRTGQPRLSVARWWREVGWRHVVGCLMVVWAVIPILYIISAAVNPLGSIVSTNLIPTSFSTENFRKILTDPATPFPRWMFNTLIVCVSVTVIQIFCSALAAYAFSRFRFRGRRGGLLTLLLIQMFPQFLASVAIFAMFTTIGDVVPALGLNTLLGYVLVLLGGSLGQVWLIKGFFDAIPKDLDEAAVMDGAGHATVFFKIILPLVRPILAVTSLLVFVSVIGEFLLASIFLRDNAMKTVAVGLTGLLEAKKDANLGVFAAGALLTAIPVVALFQYLQRYIVGGITAGAVKARPHVVLASQPHHDGSALYVEDDAPRPGDTVGVRVLVPHVASAPGAEQVHLRVVRNGEPFLSAARIERVDPAGTWWRAELRADNAVNSYRFLLAGGSAAPAGMAWLNGSGLHHRDVTDAADFRVLTHSAPPDWVYDQVVYQIFPDRFARAARDGPPPAGRPGALPDWALPAAWGDPVIHQGPDVPRQLYGGTLAGVAEHLDHLLGLGATCLYLTPVFEGRSNHRYDAVSFDRVDPVLGGNEGLRELIRAAHRAGLRVIGDITTNHTGVGHEWFRAAQADAHSAEAGYYRFTDHPDGYDSWLGVPSLPRLDHSSAPMRHRLYEGPESVVAHWLRAGLDGWRVDVANMTGRMGQDDLAHAVARTVRGTVTAENPDAWLLAEHGHDASADLAVGGWHGTMDYSGFTRPVWSWLTADPATDPAAVAHGLTFLGLPIPVPLLGGPAVAATMRAFHAAMPWRSWTSSTGHLDSHDTPRFRTVVGGGVHGGVDGAGAGRERHLLGLALQMTMPAVPSVFMGDELGLTGVDGEHARTPFPWARRDTWDDATVSAYRSWIALRRDHVALRRGGLRWVAVQDDSLTFLREHRDEHLLIHVARRDHPAVQLPFALLGISHPDQLRPLVGDRVVGRAGGVVALPSHGPAAQVFVIDKR